MNWRQFEQLTGEAFRRQGYAVEETGLGGADGGIDLKLRKDGKTTLVQCKQWRNQQVNVKTVREMLGVLVHEGADAVKIVAFGDYTPDARRFAEGKSIELIHGVKLIATVRSVQTGKARKKGPMDRLLAMIGSMLVSLVVISALSFPSVTPSPLSSTPNTEPAFKPTVTHQPPTPLTPRTQATIYASDSQNDAQLREWKKRNAESMRILEKTTKEMPLR
jgi:restriction system protein